MDKSYLNNEISIYALMDRVEEMLADPKFKKLGAENRDVSIIVCPDSDRAFLSTLFGIDLITYFKDVYRRVEFQLKTKIFHYDTFDDDSVLDNVISLDVGMYLAAGLWTELIYDPIGDPWVSEEEPFIKDIKDALKLNYPDFYKDGVMPGIHKNRDIIYGMLGERVNLTLPSWYRNPWAVARHMYGFENLLYATAEDPESVHAFMRFLVESRIKYSLDWCRYHGVKVDKNLKAPFVNGVWMGISDLSSDEVCCPSVSPGIYEEFIFPYEMKLAEFYGGIRYYHSCGDLTDLIPYIKRLPGLEVFHVGPWTDLPTAARELDDDVMLQVCLFADRDIFNASEQRQREQLRYIIQNRGNHKIQIVADSFCKGETAQIVRWLEIAREETAK